VRLLTAGAAVVLLALVPLQLARPAAEPWSVAYGVGAGLAVLATFARPRSWLLRLLAVLTAAVLFLFAGAFLARTHALDPGWYLQAGARQPLLLALAALCMMPVLAAWTCRMKGAGEAL
ncbi:MAG: hypothetical protein V2J02_07520, partial [Pseudomonadales bacterium]|jgi:hypothetical protein|nr:hypothetical protein [Pseudomonadales bacterium]